MSLCDTEPAARQTPGAKRSREEAARLASDNDGLARWSLRYAPPDIRRRYGEDLLQEARIALLRACLLWDETRGVTLGTFAAECLRRAIIRAHPRQGDLIRLTEKGPWEARQAMREAMRPVSMSEHSTYIRAPRIDLPATGTDVHADLVQVEDLARLRAALARLPGTQRDVLTRRFFLDQTLQQAADALGVTRERIRQIEAKGVERLRKLMRDA